MQAETSVKDKNNLSKRRFSVTVVDDHIRR
jgi:hypothetical protein